MEDITSLSLSACASALKKGELKATEVTAACLERILETEDEINALLHVDAEGAIELAEKMDSEGPDPAKPLWGVPVTVKDALVTKDMPTTAASRILENFKPMYDAFVVERLREAGAIIIGKNNMDEFAMGSTTENSAYKVTRNPWNTDLVPGGSSGGSAASVAAGQCFASLGSDTGGSIRQPAAFCGCVGLKPTYGRVSRYGLIAYASSLDQVGPLARTVEDCARILSVIAGHDERDMTSSPEAVPDYLQGLGATDLAGRTIGLPAEYFGDGLSDTVRKGIDKAIDALHDMGAKTIEVSLPSTSAAISAYYIVAMAEATSNLARFDGVRYGLRVPREEVLAQYRDTRAQGFGAEVKRRVLLGTFVLSSGYYDAYYNRAQKVRTLIRRDFEQAFAGCDLLLAPVTPEPAWPLGVYQDDPIRNYLSDVLTVGANLAGCCAIAIPAGKTAAGKPVGLQLLGPNLGEATLFRAAHALELR